MNPSEILEIASKNSSIISPIFTAVNFSGEVTVTYNTVTEQYVIDAPVTGNQSPGGWHYNYTIVEATSGRQLSRGSGGSVLNFRTTFQDSGDTEYVLTLHSIDDFFSQESGYFPPVSVLRLRTGKPSTHRATVFEHVNASGRRIENVGPVKRDNLFSWGMNDQISSVLLQPATKITLYDDVNFSGGSRTFMNHSNSSQIINLPSHNWNDWASPLKLSSLTGSEFGVNLFQHSHNAGMVIRNSSPSRHADLRQLNMNDRISSIELYPNTRVVLFEHINYRGEQRAFENFSNDVIVFNLAGSWWNDRASSYMSESIR